MKALEAYDALEPREKLLVSVAAGLFAVFCLWQFVISPVIDARQSADQRQANALRDYSIVQNGLPAVTSSRFRNDRKAFSRLAVSQTAQAAQLSITRLDPVEGGGFKLWFDDVPAPQVFGFIQALSAQYDVAVQRVQMNRRSSGQVNAQITLVPGTS